MRGRTYMPNVRVEEMVCTRTSESWVDSRAIPRAQRSFHLLFCYTHPAAVPFHVLCTRPMQAALGVTALASAAASRQLPAPSEYCLLGKARQLPTQYLPVVPEAGIVDFSFL